MAAQRSTEIGRKELAVKGLTSPAAAEVGNGGYAVMPERRTRTHSTRAATCIVMTSPSATQRSVISDEGRRSDTAGERTHTRVSTAKNMGSISIKCCNTGAAGQASDASGDLRIAANV